MATTVLVFALASSTSAHTELEESTPADGATLKKLPATGTLTFSEEVSANDITVKIGTSALPVSGDNAHPRTVTYDLTKVKAAKDIRLAGDCRLPRRSRDPETSSSMCGAGAGAKPSENTDAAEEPAAVGWLSVSSRTLGYLSTAVFVGGLLFVVLLAAGGRRRTSRPRSPGDLGRGGTSRHRRLRGHGVVANVRELDHQPGADRGRRSHLHRSSCAVGAGRRGDRGALPTRSGCHRTASLAPSEPSSSVRV